MEERGVINGCLKIVGVLFAMALAAGAALYFGAGYIGQKMFDADPVTVANASLQGIREQNRLSTFQARYVAVVTTTQTKMGLSARKTLIMPGLVRYEVDLSKLDQKDVAWNAQTRTLSVKLPPVEVVGPQVDLTEIKEYSEGGVLMNLTNSEARLDEANRKAGQRELVRQARQATPMKLARDATRRAVERSFAMPLRAAGIDAKVEAFFPDEKPDGERWDTTRSIGDVLANRQ